MAIRNRVVAFTMALAAVTYLDRVCIGVLQTKISADLDLTRVQMGYIFSAFAVAYAAFGVPLARWCDRDGARKVLTWVVLVWSVFTMATALAWNFISMAVIRFLFGIGEAGAWPSVARVYSRWIPLSSRGRIQGIFFAGAHLSGGLTPLVVAAMAGWLQWRMIFLVFGAAGALWAVLLTMVIWRIYPFLPARRAVAEAYRQLSELVRDLRGLVQAPWITDAAMRRASRIRRGMDAASDRPSPTARVMAPLSCRGVASSAIVSRSSPSGAR